jgi:CheY-like chemotaxis protein
MTIQPSAQAMNAKNAILVALSRHCDCLTGLFAEDGAKAIEILSRERIDLLITDLQMPKVDGLTLLSHVHNHYPDLPCIILTAYAADKKELEVIFRCYQPNITDLASTESLCLINKPFHVQNLLDAVFAALRQRACQGVLSGISIESFIQLIALEEKSCSVKVTSGSGEMGCLYFSKGIMTSAEYHQLDGEEAAIRIMCFDSPHIVYSDRPDHKPSSGRKIRTTCMALLLEASRRRDA